nr:Transmembrane secretion effector [uncultured bacterium]
MNYLINFSIFRRNRNFALLYIGQFVSLFGTMITGVALPYQIYTLTHSTLMVGLLSLCQLIPLVFTALLGGVFADRYHRRRLLMIAETMLVMGCGLLAWNAHLAEPHLWIIFAAAMFMSAFTGLHRPALESIVQQLVAKADFPVVGSLGTFKSSVCMIAGPAIGGVIIASAGVVITYVVDCLTFAVSLTTLLLMTHIPKPVLTVPDDSAWTSLKASLLYAKSRQELLGTYFVDFVAMIFGMPTALFPAIAMSFGGAKTLGLLYAAPAVGALIVSLFSGWAKDVKRHGAAVAISAVLWGVSIIFFGLSTHLTAALIFLAFAGGFDAVSGIFRSVMWNQTIPIALRGRMAGIEMISYISGPRLGDTEAGLMAAAFGITFSVISGGVLCVLGVGICCWYLPKFWHYEAKEFASTDEVVAG